MCDTRLVYRDALWIVYRLGKANIVSELKFHLLTAKMKVMARLKIKVKTRLGRKTWQKNSVFLLSISPPPHLVRSAPFTVLVSLVNRHLFGRSPCAQYQREKEKEDRLYGSRDISRRIYPGGSLAS